MGVEVVDSGDDGCEDVYSRVVEKTQISQSLFLERNFRTPVEEIRESRWQESHLSSGKDWDVTVVDFSELGVDVGIGDATAGGVVAASTPFVNGVDEEVGPEKERARNGLCSFRPSLCSSTTPSGDLQALQHGYERASEVLSSICVERDVGCS